MHASPVFGLRWSTHFEMLEILKTITFILFFECVYVCEYTNIYMHNKNQGFKYHSIKMYIQAKILKRGLFQTGGREVT